MSHSNSAMAHVGLPYHAADGRQTLTQPSLGAFSRRIRGTAAADGQAESPGSGTAMPLSARGEPPDRNCQDGATRVRYRVRMGRRVRTLSAIRAPLASMAPAVTWVTDGTANVALATINVSSAMTPRHPAMPAWTACR